jgi:hypothetical protein
MDEEDIFVILQCPHCGYKKMIAYNHPMENDKCDHCQQWYDVEKSIVRQHTKKKITMDLGKFLTKGLNNDDGSVHQR